MGWGGMHWLTARESRAHLSPFSVAFGPKWAVRLKRWWSATAAFLQPIPSLILIAGVAEIELLTPPGAHSPCATCMLLWGGVFDRAYLSLTLVNLRNLITWQWICRFQASSCLAVWTPTWLFVNCQLQKASDFFTLLFSSAAVPYFTLSSFWFCRGGRFLLAEDWIIFWKPGMSAPKRGPRVAYHDPLGQFDFIMKGKKKKKTLKTAGEKCNNVSSAIVLEY